MSSCNHFFNALPKSLTQTISVFSQLVFGLILLSFSSSVLSAGDGLKASYWNFDVSGNSLNFPTSSADQEKIDSVVDFDWGNGAPTTGINSDRFAVRWEGEIKASETGAHYFHTLSDDGVRLWINNQLVINNWSNHGSTWNNSNAISLTAGQRYSIKLEYFENSGGAVIRLHWQTPSNNTRRVIPQTQLYSAIDPQIVSISNGATCATNSNELLVTFNTSMKTGLSSDSAENATNYVLSPNMPITNISPVNDTNQQFTLTLAEPIRRGIDYTVSVANIVSASNIAITPSPQQISVSNSASGSGLYGEYWNYAVVSNGYVFPNTSPDLVQIDPTIDFNWGTTAPDATINAEYFAVRWQASLLAPSTGNYKFSTYSDDGVRVWINDVLIIDNWTLHSETLNESANVQLTAGETYNLKMEYFENETDAVAKLHWKTPDNLNRRVIPSTVLSPCQTSQTPIASYHLDGPNWDGTLDEVIDNSGNEFNATTVNDVISAFTTPAIIGEVGSCGYASFDGTNYIEISNSFDTLKGTASLTFWIKTTQTGSDTIWVAPGITGVENSGDIDDAFWGWISETGQIGITAMSNDNSSRSTIPINDGEWHHIALTRNADTGDYQIFIDGTLNKSGTTGSGIVTQDFSSLGRIKDSYAGSHFQGDLDEVQVFDFILSADQVQTLMTETHSCPEYTSAESCSSDFPSDIALYAGEKLIFYDPILVNGQSISPGYYNSALIDTNGNLQTNQSPVLPALEPEAFPSNSSRTSKVTTGNITINKSSELYYDNVMTYRSNRSMTFIGSEPIHIEDLVAHGSNTTINLSAGHYFINKLILNNSNTVINITSGPVYLHIGNQMTLHGSDIKINQNGNIDDLVVYLHNYARFTSNKYGLEFTGVIYGPNSGNTTFNGTNTILNGPLITNPKRIYINQSGFQLNYTTADKARVDALFGECDTANLDHFELSYSSGGLSCLPSAISLKACENSDCSSLYTQGVDVTLAGNGTWSSNPVTLTGGESYDLTFQASSAGDTVISVTDSSVITNNTLKCYEDGVLDADCTLPVSNAGFVFDIPRQTACKTSSDITIKAVQTDDETNQCIGALTGAQTVNFFSTYNSPSSGTMPVSISGSDIDNASPGTGVSLTFNDDGEATFTAKYNDAGEVRIDAEFDNGNGLTLTGYDSFVTNPTALYVYTDDANASCDSADASCSLFKKAGENFNLSVKAACWQSDTDNDYSNNPVTPNFELNAINVYSNLVAPSGGENASLSTTSIDFTTADAGEHNMQQSVSELGVFTFSVSPPNYFGESISVIASNNIGRFYPDYLAVTAQNDGAFGTHSCGTFTYTGQPFGYRVTPSLTVSAYNTNDERVQNYQGSFAKLLTTHFTVTAPTSDAAALGADNSTSVSLQWTPDNATLTDNNDGSHTFSFGNDSYRYLKVANNQVAPFSNVVALSFTDITDSDGVQTGSLPIALQPSGEIIRFGQLAMNNAHGSELSPLPLSVYTQYFDGTNWQINTADQCTTMTLANHLQLRNSSTSNNSWQAGTTTMLVGEGSSSASMNSMINGQALITFSAPGEDNQGYIDIQSRINGSVDWLLADTDSDGLYDDEVSSKASFGIFKGSDRIIFRREVY